MQPRVVKGVELDNLSEVTGSRGAGAWHQWGAARTWCILPSVGTRCPAVAALISGRHSAPQRLPGDRGSRAAVLLLASCKE
jgi:hypothetical protein